MLLERACELADGPGEGEVEEQLEPAGAPLIAVVAVSGPQCRLAEMHRVTESGVNVGDTGGASFLHLRLAH